MKRTILISFAVFLAMAGLASGYEYAWYWPPITEVLPENPTSSDVVTVTLSGEWPDSCIPNASSISVIGNNIYFDVILDYPTGVICLTVITPWSRTESVGPLSPGTYSVYARLIGDPAVPQTYTLMTEFIVVDSLFEDCGFLIQGVECVLFEADSGGIYVLDNYGGFSVGDRVQVSGILDPNCVTICMEGDGCILNNTISEGCNPVPDIKANGSDGPVDVALGDNLSITIELSPGDYSGYPADWWVLADAPFGWYYYDAGTKQWLRGFHVSYQGRLFALTPPREVLNRSNLPAGSYDFYFGVDGRRDGDLSEPLYYDSVEVNITP